MTEPADDHLRFARDGRVAMLTFNRPDARNAMTFEMYEGLHETCERVDEDPDVRVLVLRGAGEKSFASGTDIRQFLGFRTREHALDYESRISRVLARLSAMTKPTIAMVQGDAVGGGLFMSLACDLRLAAEHARFGAPVARTLGNCTAPLSFTLLASTIGAVRARNVLLTARLVDAAEARAIGLV
ncbi:MAG: enoyl-CoA hydratase-related protein, partial [Candidatus Rokuibacteriota bacterium]